MRPVEGGRWCERCRLRVRDAAGLDEAELVELSGEAGGRSCLRVELEGARPRLASGLAAGVLVAALAGCASAPSSEPGPAPVLELESSPGRITGVVIDQHGQPVADALVIVQGAMPTVERMTDGRGVYTVDGLSPGSYTVQVLAGRADVSRVLTLRARAGARVNVQLDPEASREILVGAVVMEEAMIDTSTASSSYKATKTVWIPD